MGMTIPSRGVDEREPTLIPDDALQDCTGAEYRVGQLGIYVARGRTQTGTLGSVTGRGLYEAGFDGSVGYLIGQHGDTISSMALNAPTLTPVTVDSFPSGSSDMVGSHYANRHYLASGTGNLRLELSGGAVTSFAIGMSASTFTIGVSVTQGASNFTAALGLEYWATEYDSSRGIESVMGSTANTGAFTSLDSVIVTLTGVSTNANSDKIRWYRSVDGGGYPDGGLIQTTAIGTTQITDVDTVVASLTVPQYGIISIGGLDTDRDEAPTALTTIFGPFHDSLLGVAASDERTLRFTPAGYPDSWPSAYSVPIETARHDVIVTGAVLPGRLGVFARDSIHVLYRLPRDADSVFAAGEAQDMLTDERGVISRRGVAMFTPPDGLPLLAGVARDGIWISDLASTPLVITDIIDWHGRVSIPDLPNCSLVNDPLNRRLVFIHRKLSDTTHNTGIWYLDYQRFSELGIRITFANHGPLAHAVNLLWTDGLRHIFSVDSRSNNGQVYLESTQDIDGSQLVNSSGHVNFRIRTKEYLPGGARLAVSLGKATWMHDAGPAIIQHRFYHDRRDSNPEVKNLADTTIRAASDVVLQRSVNSVSLELESTGKTSYGVHWADIEGLDLDRLGGRKGA